MKNSTELIGMTLLQRLRVKVSSDPIWLRRLVVGAWGLVYARAGVLGITGAFGAALVAGVGFDDSLSACVGAMLGYLLTKEPSANLGFVLLCAVVLAVKLLAGRRRWEVHRWAPCCTAGLVPIVVGLPTLFLTAASLSDYFILASQSALSVAAAFFVSNLYVAGEPVLTRRGRISETSLMVCVCIFAGGLVSLQAGGVSVGKAAAVLLTLCAAYGLGSAGGSAVGTAAGLTVAFVSGDFGLSVAVYALGGLISGVFRPLGRMAAAVAFVLCSGFVMLGTGRQMPVAAFVEVMIGSVTFFALPEPLFSRLARAFADENRDDDCSRRMAAQRLRQTAGALQEIGSITRKVAQHLEECTGGKTEEAADVISNRVCRRCSKKTLCWVHNYGESRSVMNKMMEQLQRGQAVTTEELPNWFRQRCTQPDHIIKAAETVCQEHMANREKHRKTARVRSIVVDQFEGMAMFLKGVDNEMENSRPAGAVVAARVREAFSSWGTEPLSLSCVRVLHRLEIEAVLPADRGNRVDWRTLSRLVGEAVGRSFALPQTERRSDGVVVTLYERPKYRLKIGSCQASQREGKICGDTWRSFAGRDRKQHILLSDGMGCGGQAALDSAMAVSLMTCLLKAGADHNSALRMVNSSLLVKSGEESLATMDAATIDLYNGRVTLFKAGAAPTILRQGKRAGSIESVSAPAGILNGVNFEHSSITLKEGDWLVMLSDGATAAGVDWIVEEVEHHLGDDPDGLAQRLCRAAQLRRSDGRSDDITVVCGLLEAEGY